jgi:hypothetical protein
MTLNRNWAMPCPLYGTGFTFCRITGKVKLDQMGMRQGVAFCRLCRCQEGCGLAAGLNGIAPSVLETPFNEALVFNLFSIKLEKVAI